MRRLSSALVTTALVAGLALVGAGGAHADPFHCDAYVVGHAQVNAICRTGSGTYRASVRCINPHPSGNPTFLTGPIVRVGQISTVKCGFSRASRPGVQIMSLR
jgi:hypothetical protein